jgi:hypothetical protein
MASGAPAPGDSIGSLGACSGGAAAGSSAADGGATVVVAPGGGAEPALSGGVADCSGNGCGGASSVFFLRSSLKERIGRNDRTADGVIGRHLPLVERDRGVALRHRIRRLPGESSRVAAASAPAAELPLDVALHVAVADLAAAIALLLASCERQLELCP